MQALCVLPFIHLNIHPSGQASVCCVSNAPLLDEQGQPYNIRSHNFEEIWNSRAIAEVREAMLRGERPAACASCYAVEDRGEESRRQIENTVFLEEAAALGPQGGVGAYCAEREGIDDLRTTVAQLAQYDGKPWNFDLRFDNICNLKCVICGGHSSSRIEADSVHMAWTGEQPITRQPNRFGNVEKWIKSDAVMNELIAFGEDVRYLQLAGGEPFLSRLALEWLAHLGASGRAGLVSLRIFTNLQTFDEGIIKLLEPFKKIHMILSIDGTRDVYEYVRYPGRWSTLSAHADLLEHALKDRLSQVDVTINATMSAHGASRILEVFDFAKSHGFGAMLNNAVGPAHASTNYLPNETKARLDSELRAYAARNPHFVLLPQQIDQAMQMMRTVNIADPTHAAGVRNFMRFTNDMDASRGLSFKSIQPRVYAAFCQEFGGWDPETRFSRPQPATGL